MLLPGGAHFENLKRGDIVFNAAQTEELLKNGRVLSNGGHGRIALADGTAYNVMNAYGGSSTINATGSNSTRVTGSTNAAGQTINNYNDNSTTNNTTNNNVTVSSGSGSSSSSDSSDFKETIDWVEVALERIDRKVQRLDTRVNRTYKSWSNRNKYLYQEIDKIDAEIEKQNKAYDKYIAKANSVASEAGLSSSTIKKIKNGSISIKDYTDEDTYNAIQEYMEWYEKALDCKDAILDLQDQSAALFVQAFEMVQDEYDAMIKSIEYAIDMLDEFISQSEAHGYVTSTKYYEALISQNEKEYAKLEAERAALVEKLNDAVNNGNISKNSEDWYDMCAAIDEVTLSMEELNTQTLEYQNNIRDIEWQLFDMLEDQMSNLTTEADFLISLMSNTNLYEDNGQLTETGMATMGLHAQDYNVYMAQADKYAEEIQKLDKEIAEDPYNQDLLDRRSELLKSQQDSIIAANEEKEAIRSMVEEGINIEIQALKDLVDAYEDSLDKAKDLLKSAIC